jgi:GGDEF domain-containing protein
MKYTRIEQLALLIGGVAILGGIAFWVPRGNPAPVELVAQALLFGVLLAAVTYGRRGGLVAAIVASVLYVVLRLPDLTQGQLTGAQLAVVVSRMLSFGLLGIVGGEVFMRLRYNLARLEGQSALDDWSRVYNQRFIHLEIARAQARHQRYGEPLSIVVVSVSSSVFAGFRPARQRTVVRGLADHIRADVRMVDEVARLADGRFVVVMPHTPRTGGLVVRDRLAAGVRAALGAREEAVAARCLALPEDAAAVSEFVASIAEEAVGQSNPSGVYSSSAARTLNPAATSASSAPSSSILKTSTAASPDGSTKQ